MKIFQILPVISVLLSISAAAIAQQKQQNYVYPGATWQMATDSSHWDKGQLDKIMSFVTDSTQATGVMIIDGGKVIFQYGDLKELSYIASCRKSVCAMLYGPFIENGTIDLKETIGHMGITDVGGLLPIEKTARVEDILTARSGVFHPASNGGDALYLAPKRGTKKPGTFWLYSNWDFNLAGYILEQKTHSTIYQLIDSVLAKPLQMEDWDMKEQHKYGDSTKSIYPAYHMWFSTEDMARLGYLMLRDGNWNGKQIISSAWVRKMTSMVTTYQQAVENKDEYYGFGYGYLWWLWDKPNNSGDFEGAYSAQGSYGNFITVLPKPGLVIAMKTKGVYERSTKLEAYLRLLKIIVAACRK